MKPLPLSICLRYVSIFFHFTLLHHHLTLDWQASVWILRCKLILYPFNDPTIIFTIFFVIYIQHSLPEQNLESQTTHRYGPNSFKLHRLPTPRPGQVLGLVGTNGIGKSTALKILAGKLKPNLGRFEDEPEWTEILGYFRGSDLQNFFTKQLDSSMRANIKPQYVDALPKSFPKSDAGTPTVKELLERKDERKVMESMIKEMDLGEVLNTQIGNLSGGELQRFAIAILSMQQLDVYMFDEPTSYLDVKQRLQAAATIRSLCNDANYVIIVEHDLSILDYLSDFVCCLYGQPAVYGVVTMPFSVREGINLFLSGFIPTENMRFRDIEITFKVAESFSTKEEDNKKRNSVQKYPAMSKTQGTFHLDIDGGDFSTSEIIVMLGENGTGKSTFIRMLAGLDKADGDVDVPQLNVSYKPQKIAPQFKGTVRQLLSLKISAAMLNSQFVSDVMKPMKIDDVIDHEVRTLSGGELQRVALVLALGIPADIYLIDEPSAYLDSEQRLVAAKVIKRYILHAKKTAFIVEHDFIMSTYLADRVIVYEGQPAVKAKANSPQGLVSGMNKFLAGLNITFRRDPANHRPRINKMNSQKDTEQKRAGTYFFLDTDGEKDTLDKADKAAQASSKGSGGGGAGGKRK